jgi:hypothetical protein
MRAMKYEDFELELEAAESGYRANLRSSGGETSVNFSLPFSDDDFGQMIGRLGGQWRGDVRHLRVQEERVEKIDKAKAARELGTGLFNAIFKDAIIQKFQYSKAATNSKGIGLRLLLRLPDDPQLVDLPWEYLYNPDEKKHPVKSTETPLVRYLKLEAPVEKLEVMELPLNVLVMISDPIDFPRLDFEAEKTKLEKALDPLINCKMLSLNFLRSANLEELQMILRKDKYHVFHFSGHGGFDSTLKKGVLVLKDENNRGKCVDAEHITNILSDHQWFRLVVLNSCNGARIAGVAAALLRHGLPAVVAMQFKISDKAAITFAKEFYRTLAEGWPVDAAVSEARKRIYDEGDEEDTEWGTPVLFMRSPDGVLFRTQASEVDVEVAGKGFRVVDDKIAEPAVRDLVCLSKEKIKDASKQIGEMELFKTIHDALHHIEFQCLRMMEGEDIADALPVYQGDFNDAREWIQKAIQGRKKIPQILRTLSGSLESAADDFQAAVDKPGDDALKKVVSDLKLLISRFPPKLDLIISTAAGELDLNCLIDLLAQVRSKVSAGAELEDIHDSIDKLPKIRDELAELVSKHSTLQSLDSNLRTMCSTESITANLELATEWKLIRQERANLPPMGAIDNYLTKQESAIDEAIANHNGLDAMDRLKEYLRFVSKEFLKADTRLKNLCMELGRLNPTLQSILSKC